MAKIIKSVFHKGKFYKEGTTADFDKDDEAYLIKLGYAAANTDETETKTPTNTEETPTTPPETETKTEEQTDKTETETPKAMTRAEKIAALTNAGQAPQMNISDKALDKLYKQLLCGNCG